jgi:peroxiredoxin
MSSNRYQAGQAPQDFTLKDTHGKPVTLSDFKGKQNVYLVFNRGFM